MTSVRQSEPRWHGDWSSDLHCHLYPGMDRAERHDEPRDHDQIEAPGIVLHGFLPRKEGEAHIAVAHVFGFGQSAAKDIGHNDRFAENDAHLVGSLNAFYTPLRRADWGNTRKASNHKSVTIGGFSQPHDNHSSFVSRYGEHEVNGLAEPALSQGSSLSANTKSAPHSATVAP